MAQTAAPSTTFQYAPLRTLDDFLLESARFQLPNFNDLEKWGNRVYKNLLYYQTNYFALFAGVFVLTGVIHPHKILLGITVLIGLIYTVVKCFPDENMFRNRSPHFNKWTLLGGVCVGSYFMLYLFDAVLIVLFAFFLGFSLIFVHSSIRLRNIKNKIANAKENLGIGAVTPMSMLLGAMQLQATC